MDDDDKPFVCTAPMCGQVGDEYELFPADLFYIQHIDWFYTFAAS